MSKFHGKVVIVTGGGSGIGRASALAFASEDAKVVIADVDVKGGQKTVEMIKRIGGQATLIRTDVSSSADVEKMVNRAVEVYGRLDCAFNNAGIGIPLTSVTGTSEEEWDRMIDVNLKGAWLCMKFEIPQMLEHGGGSIVNTSSIAGLVGAEGSSVYSASKHGIIGLTKSAALEYAHSGIRVNAVCPCIIDTPLIHMVLEQARDFKEQITTDTPLGRMGTPEEVARVVVWLCSEEASLITGHALAVDGGFTSK